MIQALSVIFFVGAILATGFGWGYLLARERYKVKIPDYFPPQWNDQEEQKEQGR